MTGDTMPEPTTPDDLRARIAKAEHIHRTYTRQGREFCNGCGGADYNGPHIPAADCYVRPIIAALRTAEAELEAMDIDPEWIESTFDRGKAAGLAAAARTVETAEEWVYGWRHPSDPPEMTIPSSTEDAAKECARIVGGTFMRCRPVSWTPVPPTPEEEN